MMSVRRRSPEGILSYSEMIFSTEFGHSAMAAIISLVPSSIRFAISISPSRVSNSTDPISLMYIRTGSVVLCCSDSTDANVAAASAAATSSGVLSPASIKSVSASGAISNTVIPISLIICIISSTCSGSAICSGRWSFTSA